MCGRSLATAPYSPNRRHIWRYDAGSLRKGFGVKLFRLVCAAACAAVILSATVYGDHGAAIAAAPVPKAKASLTPHKATYVLHLLRTRSGEGVRVARGSMTYILSDRCDGYTIESNVSMNLSFADGNAQKIDQRYAAWEAKDGSFSSFTMQTLENGSPGKSYRGSITLERDGSGSATFEGEKTEVFKLAPGTMLSTAHTVALLEQAAAGKNFFSGHVIDGSFDQGPFVVTATIAGARDGRATLKKEGAAISAGRYWPMSLAYFPASSKGYLPEYELGMDLLPTGISRAMTQDFGNFSIGFTLTDIEPLKPEC